MFVEKIGYEKGKEIARKVTNTDCFRFQLETGSNEKQSCLKFFVYDEKLGIFQMCIFDTHLSSEIPLENIEEKSKIAFGELSKIFGKEYENYYAKQANAVLAAS